MDALRARMATVCDKAVVEHCLGLSKISGLGPLGDNVVFITFDTESWTRDHDKLTEIGIATSESKHMAAQTDPGLHGEKLLEQVTFYHGRIAQNAHLINKSTASATQRRKCIPSTPKRSPY